MKYHHFLALAALAMTGCVVAPPPGSPRESREKYVSLPYEPGMWERQYMPEVEDLLEEYDYRPTREGGRQYRLAFEVDEGPINVESTITLYKEGRIIARGKGSDGGPHKVLNPGRVVDRAVDRSLSDFESQLERVSGWEEDGERGAYPSGNY